MEQEEHQAQPILLGEGEGDEVHLEEDLSHLQAEEEGGDEDMSEEENEAEPMEEEGERREDMSVQGFFDHSEQAIGAVLVAPVYATAISPSIPYLVCSGGGDDQAYLWKADDGETVAQLTAHKDTITDVRFSHNGGLVATAGMDGSVHVHAVTADPTAPHGVQVAYHNALHTEEEGAEITLIRWHPSGTVLMVGTSKGTLYQVFFHPTNLGAMVTQHVIYAHDESVTCGEWTTDGTHFISASMDSAIKCWSGRQGTLVTSAKGAKDARLHPGGILSLASTNNGQLVLTGGDDGSLRITNMQSGRLLGQLTGHEDSIETIHICEGLNLAVTASTDGTVRVWDLKTQAIRTVLPHSSAVTYAQLDSRQPFLLTCTVDATVHLWDIRAGTCLQTWTGHTMPIHSCAMNADRTLILSSSDDATCLVWAK